MPVDEKALITTSLMAWCLAGLLASGYKFGYKGHMRQLVPK